MFLRNFTSSEWFTICFSPINLSGLSEQHLRSMGVKPIVESIGRDDIIQVIPWRLDNPFTSSIYYTKL
jgi:hypothetical protein